MTKIHQITPFLHVRNIDEALSFFCETLGFDLVVRHSNYAYVELEGCGLRMLEEPGRVLNADGRARVAVYVDVANVDALHARLADRLSRLPADRVEPLMDRPYLMREFQVRMPDGDWLNFGQPLAAPGA